MAQSGSHHEVLREAHQRFKAARLVVALSPGERQDAALTRLRDAEAELRQAQNPFKSALDYFPDSSPAES